MKHTKLLLIVAAAFAAAATQAQLRSFVSGDQTGATVTSGRQPRYIKFGTELLGRYGNRTSVHIAYSNLLTYKGKRLYHTHKNSTSFVRFNEVGRLPLICRLFDGIISRDNNGVTVTRLYRMYSPIYRYVPGGVPNDYSSLGCVSFARVDNADMYFGDWTDVQPDAAAEAAGTNYSVFYNGTGKIVKMPTGGTAVYSVKGISHYIGANIALLTGDLKMDFTKKGLSGTIKRPGLNVTVDNAVISTTNVSSDGRATVNDIDGTIHGSFHGNGATALTGVVRLVRGPNLNIAFGDTKK